MWFIKTLSASCGYVSNNFFENIFLIELLQLLYEGINQIRYDINHKNPINTSPENNIRLKLSVRKCVESINV